MKSARFTYHSPTSIDEAVALLVEYGEDAKVLAGGQSLVPMLAMRLTRFGHLVDLNRITELAGISVSGANVTVGALTRQAAAERSTVLRDSAPLVARAIPLIGHFQIRNRGTVGGSIAHADPASELPAVALALGASVAVRGPGGVRTIPASELFVSMWETSVAHDEVVTAVHFPCRGPQSGYAIEEMAPRPGDFALTGAACAVELTEDGVVGSATVALLNMGPTPLRARDAESALTGAAPDSLDLAEIGSLAVASTSPVDDVHASAAYRRSVGAALVARAVATALKEAADG